MLDAGAFGLSRNKPSCGWKLVCSYEHICHEEIMSRMLRSCSCCHWASHSENQSPDIFRKPHTHRIVMYGTIAEHCAVIWVHHCPRLVQIFHVYDLLPDGKVENIVETDENCMQDLNAESARLPRSFPTWVAHTSMDSLQKRHKNYKVETTFISHVRVNLLACIT